MATAGLNTPVEVQATRLDATVLPANFSSAFRLYLIQQGFDFGNVAGKANDAGQGAYNAQVTNDEQDLELANHEERITSAEETILNHEERISNAESTLQNHEQRITQNTDDITLLKNRVSSVEDDVDTIQLDYVSKSATLIQTLASPISVETSYSVDGFKVVGARVTGFTAATGTALMGAFNADATFTVSPAYTQSEVQALANALVATRQRVKALEDAMRTHGLIN